MQEWLHRKLVRPIVKVHTDVSPNKHSEEVLAELTELQAK